jgi:hypothetical protein
MDNKRYSNLINVKKSLFLVGETDNYVIKDCYRKHCAILSKIINEAKKLYHYNLMNTSYNKVKTASRIIKKVPSKSIETGKILQLKLERRNINNPKDIASAFNNLHQLLKTE